jgi:hypothetical protein
MPTTDPHLHGPSQSVAKIAIDNVNSLEFFDEVSAITSSASAR